MSPPPMDVTVLPPQRLDSDTLALWADWHGETPMAVSPFVHPVLVTAAADAIGATYVAVIRHRGAIAGFFPFQRAGRSGRPPAHVMNDGDGIVLRPGVGLDVRRMLEACDLHSFSYVHMPTDPSPFSPYHTDRGPTARVDLRGGYAQYEQSLRRTGSKVIQEAGRKRRRLERQLGPLRFEFRVDHQRLVQQLVTWKQNQIAEREPGTAFPIETITAVLLRLGREPVTEGFESVLSALYAGDTLVALNWSLRSGPLLVASIPTFDLSLSDHSPGLLLHIGLIEAAAAVPGLREIDLGLDVNRLKGRLMTHTVPFARGTVYTSATMRLYRRARTAARVVTRGA